MFEVDNPQQTFSLDGDHCGYDGDNDDHGGGGGDDDNDVDAFANDLLKSTTWTPSGCKRISMTCNAILLRQRTVRGRWKNHLVSLLNKLLPEPYPWVCKY